MKSMFQKLAIFLCALALTACGAPADTRTPVVQVPQPAYSKTDLVVGTGDTAAANDLVTIAYTGFLYDAAQPNSRGAAFDSSSTFAFTVGTGTWLVGADQGIVGMKVGGKINLVLPANLAYGVFGFKNAEGTTVVAANTPVTFEIQLLSVKKPNPSATVTIIDTVVGTGADAVTNKTLTVNYTGWVYDPNAADKHGAKFDSSLDAGKTPFAFQLGVGVIEGWTRGIPGMKAGGKRTLIIPPELAYGLAGTKDSAGNVVIPANATLIFDIELLSVK
jgi:peptidylprolyl isomerase